MDTVAWGMDEGDRFFNRNHAGLHSAGMIKRDMVLKMMARHRLAPKTVMEIGCSNAWRLDEIQRLYGAECYGVDISPAAIADGQRHYPDMHLQQGTIAQLPFGDQSFDIVVIAFVFHWLPREILWTAAIEVDRVLRHDGWLIVADFAPAKPTKVPYRHQDGIYTYKIPDGYAGLFTATGMFHRVARRFFDHVSHAAQPKPLDSRAVCTMLQKQDCYVEIGKEFA